MHTNSVADSTLIFHSIVGVLALACEAGKQLEREVQSSLKAELQHLPINSSFSIFNSQFHLLAFIRGSLFENP